MFLCSLVRARACACERAEEMRVKEGAVEVEEEGMKGDWKDGKVV